MGPEACCSRLGWLSSSQFFIMCSFVCGCQGLELASLGLQAEHSLLLRHLLGPIPTKYQERPSEGRRQRPLDLINWEKKKIL